MNTTTVTTNKDALLTQWKEASELLAKIKVTEAELRKQVVEAFSHDAKPGHSGTENIDVGWGHKLKVVHKLNYKLDNANDCEKLDKVLDTIEKSMEGGNIIAERLVKWKPELSVSEYKLLSPENKARIDSVLTITDGTPEVTLIPPKGA
jgi:hypothetical protein